MKKQNNWTQRIAERLVHQEETLPMQTVLELCADRRILIENHQGITCYGPERIGVKVRFGQIIVNGSSLRLCKMQAHQLVILGNIQEITLEKGR